MLVNYCPFLGTVLANEEVEDGFSKEGGHPVERKPLTAVDVQNHRLCRSLLEDLELIDWPDHLKKLQINWIGRSRAQESILSKRKQRDHFRFHNHSRNTLWRHLSCSGS